MSEVKHGPRPWNGGGRKRGVGLAVIYLIFNEGYVATSGDRPIRGELCGEAIRLCRVLVALMPQSAEACGLLALMILRNQRVKQCQVSLAHTCFA